MKLFGRRLNMWDAFPLLWLAFLAFPISGFFVAERSPPQWTLFWGVMVVYVAVYLRAFLLDRQEERWAFIGWALSITAYALTSAVSGGQAATFLVYGGAFIGNQGSVTLALWLSVLNCFILVWPVLTGQAAWAEYAWAFPLMFFTVVAAYANHMSFRSQIAAKRLERVQWEKEKLAANAERERIACDLHDLLGHTLSVVVLKSELASKLAHKHPERAAEEIREVERISRGALSEVRAAVQGYRGSGLGAELARAKVALDAAGVALSVTEALTSLAQKTEASAAMLLREAVTNVVRHARATQVSVKLRGVAGGVELLIQDDGVGGHAPEGTGLNSMRERLRAMGGTLERDGRDGTRLRAFFPDVAAPEPESGLGPVAGRAL